VLLVGVGCRELNVEVGKGLRVSRFVMWHRGTMV